VHTCRRRQSADKRTSSTCGVRSSQGPWAYALDRSRPHASRL
jgi:hypothetical protein